MIGMWLTYWAFTLIPASGRLLAPGDSWLTAN